MIDKGRKGAPDRECRFPNAVLIYVETKDIDGRFEAGQEQYHKDLRKLGFVVLVLWTIPMIDDFLAAYDRGVYG